MKGARRVVLVRGEPCCGYCLSWRVEWAEFEVLRYLNHEGEQVVRHPGYLCGACRRVSEPLADSPTEPPDGPSPWRAPAPRALSGPTTW